MQMEYALTTDLQDFGTLQLHVTRLRNLNETIDALFAQYADQPAQDHARWLEDLCPYFGVIWPSARALTEEWVKRFSGVKHPPTVLELGCGLALPSLAAAKLGSVVIATDFHPDVPEFLELNARGNDVKVRYLEMNWRNPASNTAENLSALARSAGGFEWIIGSDILYESSHPEAVVQTFVRLREWGRSPGGRMPRILLADPGRPYLQTFSETMKKEGFSELVHVRKIPHETQPSTFREIFLLEYV